MTSKTIVNKKLPFFLLPLRALYRYIASRIFNSVRLFQIKKNNIKYLVWANEDIGKRLILQGGYETNELLAFHRLIRQGDVCVDVGGNVGIFSLNFAKCCKNEGKVYVIEPIRKNQLVIELAAIVNGIDNIQIFPFALSDRDGEVVLEIPSIDGAYAYIKNSDQTGSVANLTVRCLPLDVFVNEQNIMRIDILKIDVEGAEMLVLEGGKAILSDPVRRPRVVMVELVDEFLNRYGSNVSDVLSMMGSLGYQPFYAHGNGELLAYKRENVNKLFNVFFIIPD